MKRQLSTILSSLLSGIIGAFFVIHFYSFDQKSDTLEKNTSIIIEEKTGTTSDLQQVTTNTNGLPTEDFVEASDKSTGSVVFIETLSEVEFRTGGWMDWFFEPRSSERVGSGSGVVLSNDGYIVTNNHVIEGADEITVIAGKKSFQAELIGRDPSSDLAVLKVESNDLPAIKTGDSDLVNVGEWVLAVGNPFNLTSTVTAGIVSAKGRSINILRDNFPIESFIQTDAAINPGNSGGALVNSNGELIGINTAILSRTGSYAGYGFAIPINIVKKVFKDIVEYGEVQKAFLGAEYIDIDLKIASRLQINDLDGVIISNIQSNGSADKSGLRKRDVIRKINGMQINTRANVEEILGESYPGDELLLIVEREGEIIEKTLRLTNRNGEFGVIKRIVFNSEELEATFEKISLVEKELLGTAHGIKVIDYGKNGVFSNLGIPKGFIITQINNREIDDPEEFEKILIKIRGRFDIIGINERGRRVYYPFRR